MRKLWLIAICLVVPLLGWGQQEPLYSQYMFNPLAVNPAYAGSREYLSIVMTARQQWSGLENAPQSLSFAAHAPTVDLRHGYGVMVVHDRAGFTQNTRMAACYAYRAPVGEGKLALGLQMGADAYRVRLSDAQTWDPNDPAFTGGDFRRTHFIAGAGAYFSTERSYLGLSVPNFVPSRLYDPAFSAGEAHKYAHAYFTAGTVFDIGAELKAKPTVLLRKASGTPLGLELSLNMLFAEKLWAGASWRKDSELIFLLQYQLTRQLRLGYSYDYPLSPISGWAGPSHELLLGLDMDFIKKKMESPRLF